MPLPPKSRDQVRAVVSGPLPSLPRTHEWYRHLVNLPAGDTELSVYLLPNGHIGIECADGEPVTSGQAQRVLVHLEQHPELLERRTVAA